jgi:hypothetical protein
MKCGWTEALRMLNLETHFFKDGESKDGKSPQASEIMTYVLREVRELSLLLEISTKLNESLDLKRCFEAYHTMTAEHMKIPRAPDHPERTTERSISKKHTV